MDGSFGLVLKALMDRQKKSPEDFSRGLGGGDGRDGLCHGVYAGLGVDFRTFDGTRMLWQNTVKRTGAIGGTLRKLQTEAWKPKAGHTMTISLLLE